MTKSPLISILTPVYNVEKYLRQCLESLTRQTLEDIEFICINDGSTDRSLEILEEYARNDERFTIIDKPNSGYGASMNRGLEAARGEYVGIVESDDFIDEDGFEKLYQLATQFEKPDIVKANHYRYSESGQDAFVENYGEPLCNRVLSPLDDDGVVVIQSIPAIWAAIYRHDFILENDVDFLESPGASFQDTGFVLKSWIACSSFALTHDAYLHYRIDNSGSSVKDERKVYCVCDELASIEQFLSRFPDRADYLAPHIQLKKDETYAWNLGRIGAEFKKDFLHRYAAEFATAEASGQLHKSLFPKKRWARLRQIIDNSDSVYFADDFKRRSADRIKVSIVVPVYNAMPYLAKTLKSIRKQTLSDIEVIIVNDGSTDNSQQCIDEFCESDKRFKSFSQQNMGVSAARNLGLKHVRGKYVTFCDADDLLPVNACEALYRKAKLADADIAIGREDEFTVVDKQVYARSEWLSKRARINKYDVDINWNLSLCNKLLRTAIIKDHGIAFGDELITEDGIFLCRYLKYADRIVGCPGCVYRYRRHLFFESKSATQRIDLLAVQSYFESAEKVRTLREECADYDIARLSGKPNEELLANQVRARAAFVSEDATYRMLSTAIERYYRWLWKATPEAFNYLVSSLENLKARIYPEHWDDLVKYNSDLNLQNGFATPQEWAANPHITLIITPQDSEEEFLKHIESIFLQRFPGFELFISERNRAWTPAEFANLPNVHYIDANSREEMINIGVACAQAGCVNILDDKLFHTNSSLRAMWNALAKSYSDFVCIKPEGISRGKKKPLIIGELLYSQEFTSDHSHLKKFLAIDSSLGNKLFKKSALEKVLPFGSNRYTDVNRMFEELAFDKLANVNMMCFERDNTYVDRLPEPIRTSWKLFYRWRSKNPYKPSKPKSREPKSRRIKERVLFCSNRGESLSTSMQLVHDALPEFERIVLATTYPGSSEHIAQLRQALVESKVIVTDDYIHELRSLQLDESQAVIQLWHACGALKAFGMDNIACDIRRERATHNQYDSVMVSDESVRGIYANAFGVDVSKVKAYGVPRTDLLLNESSRSHMRNSTYHKHPELMGKQVILYCPTFREEGAWQVRWDTNIHWRELDSFLDENQLFVVKPHPLEISDLCPAPDLRRITLIDDVSSDELMATADLLVTDCSSILYDYSLLNKPVLFYFPDYETYERDFYFDFPASFGREVITASNQLSKAIQDALSHPSEHAIDDVRNGMMGACDGRSTERIADYIKSLLKSEETFAE